MTQVYQRPAEEFRRNMAVTHGDVVKSLEAAHRRLDTIAETDLRLVANRAERDVYAQSKRVVGYRRVIHPELSKSGTCGLCIVAADRFYTLKELQPMHDRCKCTTAPIVKGSDPGLNLNRADLDRLYAAAGGNTRVELKDIRVKELVNGEIGPILTRAGQEIKILDGFEEKTLKQQRFENKAMRATSTKWVIALEKAKRTGEPVSLALNGSIYQVDANDQALAYHKNLLANLARKAA